MATADSGAQPRHAAMVATTGLAPAAWGLTYLVTTELLPADRPFLAGLLRALPAGLVLAALTRQRPSGQWWTKSLALGTLNIGGFFALLFVAAYHCRWRRPPCSRPASTSFGSSTASGPMGER